MKLGSDLEPLDGDNIRAFELSGKNQTGVHRLAIQKYRARATVARAAAFFGAGHADLVAQQIEQQAVRGNFTTDVLPV